MLYLYKNNRLFIQNFSAFSKLESLEKEQQLDVKDSYLTFHRQWKELCNQIKNEKPRVWTDKLNNTQTEKINLLVKHVSSLGPFELRYFDYVIKQQCAKYQVGRKLNQQVVHHFFLQNFIDGGVFPSANPKWLMQQEALAKLWPLGQQGMAAFLSQVLGGSGGQSGQPQQTQQEQKVEETKVEKKIEKSSYDIELAAIDQAQKLKVIKEVREIFKLGLKEAKELVEKAPCVLQKGVKKEDADIYKEKLIALNCTVNLL